MVRVRLPLVVSVAEFLGVLGLFQGSVEIYPGGVEPFMTHGNVRCTESGTVCWQTRPVDIPSLQREVMCGLCVALPVLGSFRGFYIWTAQASVSCLPFFSRNS